MRKGQKIAQAQSLRSNMTEAEKRQWYRLRGHRFFGLKFRRQYPIGPYIVDFACLEHSLIIELDGGQHATHLGRDGVRDKFISQQGFTVLRFWNNEVLENFDSVLEMIALRCKVSPLPNPLPHAGEGTSTQLC